MSDNLGSNAECTVDHRIVRVTNVAAIATVQEVSLTIENVQNPAAGSTGTFYIYHLDVDGVVKASLSTTGPTITALPSSNITIKSITTTSSEY